MLDVVVAVPVKPFDAAKRRLADVVPPESRRRLSRALAERTLEAARQAGGSPLVLAADAEVAQWADGLGLPVLVDAGSGLDRAADGAVRWAAEHGARWLVCHSDLPLVEPADLRPAVLLTAAGAAVIAPSSDGGTSLLGGGPASLSFGYGPASFHRHLARLGPYAPRVLWSAGLALDLDTPADLAAALAHPRGRWLADLVAAVGRR